MKPLNKNNTSKAILAAIVSAFAITCMNYFTKVAQYNVSYEMIVFVRFFISSVVIFPFITFDKNLSLKTSHYALHLLRACTGFLTVYLLIYSLKYLSVVEATLLFMTYPLFVPLLLFLIKKEKTNIATLVSIMAGFIGLIIILNPRINQINLHVLLGLGSGIMAAIGILCMGALGKTEPARRTVFYFSSHATLFAFIILLFFGTKMPSNQSIFLLLSIGSFGVIYQQGIAYALRLCHPVIVMPILYFSLIFSGILDWITWDQVPSWHALLGYILVILGALLTIRFSFNAP